MGYRFFMRCLVAGATGLVGSALQKQLLADVRVEKVVTIVRKPSGGAQSKLNEVKVDFDNLFETNVGEFDAAFCCLGTTIKKAGSQEAFRKVDHDFVLQFADLAKRSGARKFLIVTALGANAKSLIFYNRVKGEVEDDLRRIGFESLVIFRPSLLLGERSEPRTFERLAIQLYPVYRRILVGPLAKQTPIHAEDVARAMLEAAFEPTPKHRVVMNHEMLGMEP
ncbi:MAG: oxidoreductase [Bdellovibrionia bacterium]